MGTAGDGWGSGSATECPGGVDGGGDDPVGRPRRLPGLRLRRSLRSHRRRVWQATSETAAPQARFLHVAEWSGSEMIVWSGCEAPNGCWDREPMGDGARYDPAADSWSSPLSRRFAPPARKLARSVWSGDEMIVWGGQFANELDDGGRYCPQGPGALIFADGFESGDISAWSGSVP